MRLFINIPITCRICKRKYNIRVHKENYHKWLNHDGLIQNLLPEVPKEERELLLSKTCGKCWDELFPLNDSNN